jgi:hypothetical protein
MHVVTMVHNHLVVMHHHHVVMAVIVHDHHHVAVMVVHHHLVVTIIVLHHHVMIPIVPHHHVVVVVVVVGISRGRHGREGEGESGDGGCERLYHEKLLNRSGRPDCARTASEADGVSYRLENANTETLRRSGAVFPVNHIL